MGSRCIALLFIGHCTRRGCEVSVTPRPLFTPGKDPVPIVQKAGWAPGPVWTGAENLAPPGFDPRTVQPVASRYTDYATRPTTYPVRQLIVPPKTFCDNALQPTQLFNRSACLSLRESKCSKWWNSNIINTCHY